MNRRTFLASLLATAVLDPEKLLWVPGKKKIFIPKPDNHIILDQMFGVDFDWNTKDHLLAIETAFQRINKMITEEQQRGFPILKQFKAGRFPADAGFDWYA